MFRVSRRRHALDIWPGFVDAIATLLMVVIFVLMAFVLAQFYLTDALTSKDQSLALLTSDVDRLNQRLSSTEALKSGLEKQIAALQKTLEELGIKNTTIEQEKLQTTAQLQALTLELKKLTDILHQEEAEKKEKALQMEELQANFTLALKQKVEELEALNQSLLALQDTNAELSDKIDSMRKKRKFMDAYQSEFFALLKKTIGDRSDIRVVGDRFVFQSEVLFEKGSAELGEHGKERLDSLVHALQEIIEKIPDSVNWILRVDGHTDNSPIQTRQYPSNWELSTNRAISVVKYLVAQGIPSRHLVAAGFGEFQPLGANSDEAAKARNRRIEFKLDQR